MRLEELHLLIDHVKFLSDLGGRDLVSTTWGTHASLIEKNYLLFSFSLGAMSIKNGIYSSNNHVDVSRGRHLKSFKDSFT